MASLATGLLIETHKHILTSSSPTDVYEVGSNGESALLLVGVMVVDSTGSVGAAARVAIRRGGTDYVLVSTGQALPSATENLEFICEPALRMIRGETVRITGASGHHCFVSYHPIGKDVGLTAQR